MRTLLNTVGFLVLFVGPLACSIGQCCANESSLRTEFLKSNCYDCHAGPDAEGGLDLEKLPLDLDDEAVFATWTQIYDRVHAGEMPPPEDADVDPEQANSFLVGTEQWLSGYQLEEQQVHGRVRGRRLTNLQLERTLHDLLGIDIPLMREMPEEPKTGNYSTLASRQSISHFSLAQHLRVVDLALDEAFRRALTRGDEWTRELSAKKISRTRTRTREPEFIDGGAVVWSSKLSFYGRVPATEARHAGWYRFRFQVSALNKPKDHGVWCTVRTGQCVSSAPLMTWVDAFEATDQPKEVVVESWLPKGHMLEIRPGDITLKMARFQGGQSANGEGGRQNVPGIRIDGLRIERIHQKADDETIRSILLGDLEVTNIDRRTPGEVNSREPYLVGKKLIREFARRAFRRSVDNLDLTSFEKIFQQTHEDEKDLVGALRAAYRAILCSARFMYLQERPGQLDGYAVASRLSYLLWGSMPDETLFELAATGKLIEPEVAIGQVARMLDDPKGETFVPDFASEWLELSEISFTEPDRKLCPDFDPIVQNAMLDETHGFVQVLLDQDLGVQMLVDTDFTFANSRLARYYGIDGVVGDRLRKIEVDGNSHRGGLLAHGAILKVTANGTNTSPVLRGVWIANRLLGQPIPPPPTNVPAIEPDIRGTKTVREQLAKHRNDVQCASCHSKIDPIGFALENFGPAGKWRDFYPKNRGGKIKKGPQIDASYITSDGRPFSGFSDFKELAALDPEPLAKNFACQLLCYGTGAEITFADRRDVQKIVNSVRESGYGLRSILESVVASKTFLTK